MCANDFITFSDADKTTGRAIYTKWIMWLIEEGVEDLGPDSKPPSTAPSMDEACDDGHLDRPPKPGIQQNLTMPSECVRQKCDKNVIGILGSF